MSAVAFALGVAGPAHAKATFTTFIVGSSSTIPSAIDRDGDIAGTYFDNDGTEGGFVRDGVTGDRVKFQFNDQRTSAFDIDDSETITGSWEDANQ